MAVFQGNEKGFTLLELLIALTIFAVGLLGIAGLQMTSITQNSRSNTRSIEVALGEGVLEEILAKAEDDPLFAASFADAEWDLDPLDDFEATLTIPSGGRYGAVWSVTVNTPVAGISRVDVTIDGPLDMDAGNSRRRTLTLTGSKRVAL
jgi:type IV pilus assembly protein PilV